MLDYPAFIREICEPIFHRVKDRSESLSGLHRFGNSGIEGWLKVEAAAALGSRFERFGNEGPDLLVRYGDTNVMIELKAATDLNASYLRGGVTKYPSAVGCIFLGDGSNRDAIDKLGNDEVRLAASTIFQDAEGAAWVIGFLHPARLARGTAA
jgi:hypothetical protein